jgi:hypothetical protein
MRSVWPSTSRNTPTIWTDTEKDFDGGFPWLTQQ